MSEQPLLSVRGEAVLEVDPEIAGIGVTLTAATPIGPRRCACSTSGPGRRTRSWRASTMPSRRSRPPACRSAPSSRAPTAKNGSRAISRWYTKASPWPTSTDSESSSPNWPIKTWPRWTARGGRSDRPARSTVGLGSPPSPTPCSGHGTTRSPRRRVGRSRRTRGRPIALQRPGLGRARPDGIGQTSRRPIGRPRRVHIRHRSHQADRAGQRGGTVPHEAPRSSPTSHNQATPSRSDRAPCSPSARRRARGAPTSAVSPRRSAGPGSPHPPRASRRPWSGVDMLPTLGHPTYIQPITRNFA